VLGASVSLEEVPNTGLGEDAALTIVFWLSIAMIAGIASYYILGGRRYMHGLMVYGARTMGVQG
jgi:hypothetical protein